MRSKSPNYLNESYDEFILALATDGSLHVAYSHNYYIGTDDEEESSFLSYSRSLNGTTWTASELLHGADTYDDNNVAPGLGGFVARSYDDAEALLIEIGGSLIGNYALFARRCGTPDFYGWPRVTLPLTSSSFDITWMAANTAGYPSFFVTETGGRGVLTTQ